MFNPICLFIDAILSISLAWNEFLIGKGLAFLVIPDDGINQMFDLFFFFCQIEEIP